MRTLLESNESQRQPLLNRFIFFSFFEVAFDHVPTKMGGRDKGFKVRQDSLPDGADDLGFSKSTLILFLFRPFFV
jgi:hypothetical protein